MAKERQQSGNQGEQLVQFRHRDAQRIVSAVTAHEARRRDRNASTLPRATGGGGGGGVRICTFVGGWGVGQLKTVQFLGVTTAPSTTVAINLFSPIVPLNVSNAPRHCAIAKDGAAWYLIAAEC
jgi:hypothetical protein